jgi:mercuric ion transport protein
MTESIVLTWNGTSEQIRNVRRGLHQFCVARHILPCWSERIDPHAPFIIRIDQRKVVIHEHMLLNDGDVCRHLLAKEHSSVIRKLKFYGSTALRKMSYVLVALAIIFFPKCPFCWLAYFSFASAVGLTIPYSPWALPLLYALLIILTIAVYFKCKVYKLQSVALLTLGIALLTSKGQIPLPETVIQAAAFSILLTGIFLEPILLRLKKRFDIEKTRMYL